jgi:hypothetical protein
MLVVIVIFVAEMKWGTGVVVREEDESRGGVVDS